MSGLYGLAILGAVGAGIWSAWHERGEREQEESRQAAAWEEEDERWRLEEERWQAMLPVEILVSESLDDQIRFRVSIRGETVGELGPNSPAVAIPDGAVSELPEIQIQQRIPDGWVDVAWELLSKERVESPRRDLNIGMERRPPAMKLYGSYLPTVQLLIDNRDHAAVLLQCGAVQAAVRSDTWTRIDFPAPQSAAHADFIIDAEVVGRLPLAGEIQSESPDSRPDAHALVDTSGGRNYRRETVYYGDFPIFDESSNRSYYRQQKLHLLPGSVSNFIDGAPESIEVFEGMIMDSRTELVEIDN